ncbi:uncharacterized protein LODBEIA_P60990 [Lodderomyces beijingensis]|uniref:Bromo domain-containing protein n=1 Tax=Lodderomyces beijingensis TaxID=1775926 RepID=A0ABP0ZUQ5_9ASCO
MTEQVKINPDLSIILVGAVINKSISEYSGDYPENKASIPVQRFINDLNQTTYQYTQSFPNENINFPQIDIKLLSFIINRTLYFKFVSVTNDSVVIEISDKYDYYLKTIVATSTLRYSKYLLNSAKKLHEAETLLEQRDGAEALVEKSESSAESVPETRGKDKVENVNDVGKPTEERVVENGEKRDNVVDEVDDQVEEEARENPEKETENKKEEEAEAEVEEETKEKPEEEKEAEEEKAEFSKKVEDEEATSAIEKEEPSIAEKLEESESEEQAHNADKPIEEPAAEEEEKEAPVEPVSVAAPDEAPEESAEESPEKPSEESPEKPSEESPEKRPEERPEETTEVTLEVLPIKEVGEPQVATKEEKTSFKESSSSSEEEEEEEEEEDEEEEEEEEEEEKEAVQVASGKTSGEELKEVDSPEVEDLVAPPRSEESSRDANKESHDIDTEEKVKVPVDDNADTQEMSMVEEEYNSREKGDGKEVEEEREPGDDMNAKETGETDEAQPIVAGRRNANLRSGVKRCHEEMEDSEEEEETKDDKDDKEEREEKKEKKQEKEKKEKKAKEESPDVDEQEGEEHSTKAEGSKAAKKTQGKSSHIPESRKRSRSHSPAPVQLQKKFQSIAVSLLNSIQEHRFSSPFLQAVNAKDAPNYYELIYQPKDLKSIFKALKSKSDPPVYSSILELERDVMLMFANCIMYNRSNEALVELTRKMKEEVEGMFKMFKEAELQLK